MVATSAEDGLEWFGDLLFKSDTASDVDLPRLADGIDRMRCGEADGALGAWDEQELEEEQRDAEILPRFMSEGVRSWDAAGGAAMLKMRCETSGSSYAMFWERYQYIVPSHIFQPATAQTLKTISMVTVYSKRTGALTSESFRQERLRHHGCRDLRDARAQGEPSEDGNDRFLS